MLHAISACRFFYKMQSSWLRNLFLGGGRSQLFRAILSTAAFKKVARDPEVDKNREKYLDFVYRIPQKWRARPRSRQKWSKKPEFCLPLSSKPRGLVSCQLGGAAKISLHAAHLHSALSKCSIASPLHPKALDFTKKEPPKIGRFLRCAAFIFFSVIRS